MVSGADKTQLAKDLKLFKENWDDVLKLQYDATEAFATLYKPIEADDTTVELLHQPTPTPQKYMEKCLGLQRVYAELRTELQQEILMIDNKLVKPVNEARQQLKPLKGTIKHRENMKLDYERYAGRTEHVRKKESRSVKEETNLAKHEASMAQAQLDYQSADDQVRETFPPITAAIIALVPMLLNSQIRIQTTLVGQLYTVLDEYTRKHDLPNPAPSDGEIIAKWNSEFTGLRKELEDGISTIAHGTAVKMPMKMPQKADTVSGLGIRGKIANVRSSKKETPSSSGSKPEFRRDSGPPVADEEEEAPPQQPPRPRVGRVPSIPVPAVSLGSKPRIPSSGAPPPYSPGYGTKTSPPMTKYPTTPNPWNDQHSAGDATPGSVYATPRNGVATPLSSAPLNGSHDYFGGRRVSNGSVMSATSAASLAAKKKPPPPVPVKRVGSTQAMFVTALFDFEGQNESDLAFREGDRIRIVKRTDSVDDW